MVVDFHATWCGPCKMIAPHLEEMDKTMDDVVFLKVDVDECEDIAEEYKVWDTGKIILAPQSYAHRRGAFRGPSVHPTQNHC